MKKYVVKFSGWYIVEADSKEESLETSQDDAEYAECQNEECFIQRPPQSWCYVEEM